MDKSLRLTLILISVLLILVFSSLFGFQAITGHSVFQTCKDVQVPYEEQEEYTDTVPYTAQDCNYITPLYKTEYIDVSSNCIQQECESYAQVCIEKNFWGNCISYGQGSCQSYKCVKYQQTCGVKITNQERQGTYFNLNLQVYNYDSQQRTSVRIENLWVSALDSNQASWSFTYLPTDRMGCVYDFVDSPQIQECKDTIKYRDMTKTRTITKYRTENVCN
ncbi:MAG: hypothetical protein AABX17_01455 [Nanoarchaeota archaeon]